MRLYSLSYSADLLSRATFIRSRMHHCACMPLSYSPHKRTMPIICARLIHRWCTRAFSHPYRRREYYPVPVTTFNRRVVLCTFARGVRYQYYTLQSVTVRIDSRFHVFLWLYLYVVFTRCFVVVVTSSPFFSFPIARFSISDTICGADDTA